LETIHPPGDAIAREAATTLPAAKNAGRIGLTGAGLTAGGMNTGATLGMFSAIPAVEPVSLALGTVASIVDLAASVGAGGRADKLRALEGSAGVCRCDHAGAEHDHLRREVLPYVIGQQEKRKRRKMRAAVPVVGALGEAARGIYMHYKKKGEGTLGVERRANSDALARHLTGSNCELAEGMVKALFGERRMGAIKGMEPERAADAIFRRLKTN
jgi:hypothetical protein